MPKTSSGRNQALHEIESPCAASEIRNNEYAHDAENSRPNSVEQLHSGQINRITAQRVEDAPNGTPRTRSKRRRDVPILARAAPPSTRPAPSLVVRRRCPLPCRGKLRADVRPKVPDQPTATSPHSRNERALPRG